MTFAFDEVEVPSDEPEVETDAQKHIGRVIDGRYRLRRYLGSGGSGHVYEGEHLALGKPVAIKLLRSDAGHGKTAQRFRREAKVLARIDNQHVVCVFDCGKLEDQTPYLVMELLEGEDLRSLLNRLGSLPMPRAIQIIVEACHGLTSVHAAGLIHRDLKPENLFIARRAGGEDWCKILDFGVVKMESTLSTLQGAIVGTARYMAPEQLASDVEVGPATDIYALGAILHECLSGQPLHRGESVHQVMYHVMNDEPGSLAMLCPRLPRQLVEVVERSLSRSPEDRPQTAAELAKQLSAAVADAQVPTDNLTMSEDRAAVADIARTSAATPSAHGDSSASSSPASRSKSRPWLGSILRLGGASIAGALLASRFLTFGPAEPPSTQLPNPPTAPAASVPMAAVISTTQVTAVPVIHSANSVDERAPTGASVAAPSRIAAALKATVRPAQSGGKPSADAAASEGSGTPAPAVEAVQTPAPTPTPTPAPTALPVTTRRALPVLDRTSPFGK